MDVVNFSIHQDYISRTLVCVIQFTYLYFLWHVTLTYKNSKLLQRFLVATSDKGGADVMYGYCLEYTDKCVINVW